MDDDHITGVLTEHQAGRCLNMKASGINMIGRKHNGAGSVGKIATTLTPRISDTSFSIQVDGNLQ